MIRSEHAVACYEVTRIVRGTGVRPPQPHRFQYFQQSLSLKAVICSRTKNPMERASPPWITSKSRTYSY